MKETLKSVWEEIKKVHLPDLFCLPKPVTINSPLSMMECIALDIQYLDHYLLAYY